MKEAVIYYSLTGVTEVVAKAIAEQRKCDIIKIELKEPYTTKTAFSKGVVDTKKGATPELGTLPSFDGYNRIWLGTPIWAFGYAAPLNSILEKKILDSKEIILFSTSAGLAGDKSLNSIKAKLLGSKVVAAKNFMAKSLKDLTKVRDWVLTVK